VKILLALPTGGNPAAPFLESLASIELPKSTTAFDRLTITGNFVPGQREVAARRAVSSGADVLIMLDDDMVLAPSAVADVADALVANPALAIVGALYYSRDGIRPMAADRWNSSDTTTATTPPFTDSVTFVDAVGFGCVAIRVDALRKLAPPYFSTQVFVEQTAARVRICNEDYLLCERMRAAGYRIGLHAGARCKHFDRQSGIAQPIAWEAPHATSVERMMVAEPGPRFRLVAYDNSGARAGERHEIATLDYLIVD
jgi:GT2 family glycosyltransferase